MPTDVIRIQTHQGTNDCSAVALSMYLGVPYGDVMGAVGQVVPARGTKGLWTSHIIRVAAVFGEKLKRRRHPDLDECYGILCTPDHAALIRNGLVIETNGSIWPWDVYLKHEKLTERDVFVLSAD